MHSEIFTDSLLIDRNSILPTRLQTDIKILTARINGIAVVTTDHSKRVLINASQELHLRQDELKEDFSFGIVQLLKALYNNTLEELDLTQFPTFPYVLERTVSAEVMSFFQPK